MQLASLVVPALLATAAALAGCGGGPRSPQSDAPARLSAGLVQYREDEVARVVKIQLANNGTAGVVVTRLRLDWPGLETATTAPDYPLGVGQEAALPLPYSAARCPSGSTAPPSASAIAVVTVQEGSGTDEVRLRLADEEQVLARIWTMDCRRQLLDAAVDVRFGTSWTPTVVDGVPGLKGTIEVRRKAAEEDVSVEGISGSVLLDIVPAAPVLKPLLRLSPGESSGSLAVEVATSRRCDGHAIGEAKKPYEFNVQIAVGDDPPGAVTITPDAATKRRMLDVIQAGCGLNS